MPAPSLPRPPRGSGMADGDSLYLISLQKIFPSTTSYLLVYWSTTLHYRSSEEFTHIHNYTHTRISGHLTRRAPV